MKYSTFALLFLLYINGFSQTDSAMITKIQDLRHQSKFTEIINLLTNELERNQKDMYLNYQLACYYSLLNDTTNAFELLNKSIAYGADGKDILTDTDFENLHLCMQWCHVQNKIDEIYLEENKNITHRDLAKELYHIYIEDQRYRTLTKNYKKEPLIFGTPAYSKVSIVHEKLTNKNLKRLQKIIRKHGWPTYSMVGAEAASGAFYLIQHAERRYIKRYIKLMKEAAMKGEASKPDYARMYDRLCIFQGKKQCFGTQLLSPYIVENGIRKLGPSKFYPIENYETVNDRRREMDLEPIENYAKIKGVIYNPNEEVEMHKY